MYVCMHVLLSAYIVEACARASLWPLLHAEQFSLPVHVQGVHAGAGEAGGHARGAEGQEDEASHIHTLWQLEAETRFFFEET